MTSHLHRDMEKLEKNLLYVAAQVEEAVRRAMASLFEGHLELAEKVIEGDIEIDRREVEVEEDCLKILALHQPVATDLRFITACLKINNDLERIGDLACNIAKRARRLSIEGLGTVPVLFHDMTESVTGMLRDAIDAFVKSDLERATSVLGRDDHVDSLNKRVIHGLMPDLRGDEVHSARALAYGNVSKHLERIADHATNIAEDVVYMVSGDIIRHRGKFEG